MMENKNSTSKIVYTVIAIVVAIGLLFGMTFFFKKDKGMSTTVEKKASLDSIVVNLPFFEVEAKNVSKIEIYGIPTGTEVTDADHVLLSVAEKVREDSQGQLWKGKIPEEPLLLSQIYAIGFDAEGNKTEKLFFALTGATDIYNALWQNTLSEIVEFKVGQSIEVNGVSVTLDKITSDNRCPVGTQCIVAGNVGMALSAESLGSKKTFDLNTETKQSEAVFGQIVTVKRVEPQVMTGNTITDSDYVVTLLIEQELKS